MHARSEQNHPLHGILPVLALVACGQLGVIEKAEAAVSCNKIMKDLYSAEQALLGPSRQLEPVEQQFNTVYAKEQQLKAQAVQARCDKRGSDLAACASIEPQLGEVTSVRRRLQNQHNSLVSQISKYKGQVKTQQALFKTHCSNGPPPYAPPTLTAEQAARKNAERQVINTLIGIGIQTMIQNSGPRIGGPVGTAGCPPGTHPRKDGQPGCHAK